MTKKNSLRHNLESVSLSTTYQSRKHLEARRSFKQNAKKLLKTTMSHKYLLLLLNVRCTHLANNDYCICCWPKGPMGAGFKGWAKANPQPACEKVYRTDFLTNDGAQCFHQTGIDKLMKLIKYIQCTITFHVSYHNSCKWPKCYTTL